jgi:hypothetical protein
MTEARAIALAVTRLKAAHTLLKGARTHLGNDAAALRALGVLQSIGRLTRRASALRGERER